MSPAERAYIVTLYRDAIARRRRSRTTMAKAEIDAYSRAICECARWHDSRDLAAALEQLAAKADSDESNPDRRQGLSNAYVSAASMARNARTV